MRNITFTAATFSLTVVVIGLVLAANEGHACSPGGESGVSPADGAVDVPTNASLFFASLDAPSNAALVDEVTGARTQLVFERQATLTEIEVPGLQPSTSYRVELDAFEDAEGVLVPGRTLRFTTAAGSDEAEPVLGDVGSDVTVDKIPGGLTFGEGCSFMPFPYWRDERIVSNAVFELEVSSDVQLVRLFRTLESDPDGARVERSITFTNGATNIAISDFTTDVGNATYEIVAVDAAGNEVTETVDASLGQLAGGCSQAGPGTMATTAAPIVAVLAMLRARRRKQIGRA